MATTGTQWQDTLKWLEEACAALFTNPAAASEALLQFRDRDDILDSIQHILFVGGAGVTEVVQHQCVAALQHSALKNWDKLSHDARLSIVSNCWMRATANDVTHLVRSSLINTGCLLWKRGWPLAEAQGGGWAVEAKESMFQTMRQSMTQADSIDMSSLAAGFLTGLVTEFGSTKSNAMGLPLEFHREAHTSFETDGSLERILQMGMELLNRSVASCSAMDKRAEATILTCLLNQLRSATALVAEVLLWQHGVLNIWAIPSAETLLKPPESWRPLLVQPQFLGCIFTAYRAARILPFNLQGQARSSLLGVAHEVRQLLILLASLSGKVFSSDGERSAYATFMLDGTVQLLGSPIDIELACTSVGVSSSDIKDASAGEARDMATLFRRLVSNFNLRTCLSPIPEFPNMLSKLADATCHLLRGAVAAAQIERDELDDPWQLQSANTMLEGWARLANASSNIKYIPGNATEQLVTVVNMVEQLSGPLFSAFIFAHLDIASADAHHVLEEDGDELGEEAATDELGSSLECCASLGRLCPHIALPLIAGILGSAEPLPASPQAMTNSLFGSGGASIQVRLQRTSSTNQEEISEDDQVTLDALRIVVLSAGYLLADSGDGEVPAIPRPLIHPTAVPYVLQLSSAVYSVCELELSHLTSAPFHPMRSPLVAETIIWFSIRWSRTYFEPDPSLYPVDNGSITSPTEVVEGTSLPLPLASLTNPSLAHLLVRCFIMYGTVWPHEQSVVSLGCELLSTLTRPKRFLQQRLVAQLDCFKELVTANGTSLSDRSIFPGRLTQDSREKLMSELIAGSLSSQDTFEALIQPLQSCLQQLLSVPQAQLQGQLLEDIHLILRLFSGVTLGASSSAEMLIERVFSYLDAMRELMNKVVKDLSMIEPFLLLAKNTAEALLPFASPTQSIAFFIYCENLLTVYGRVAQSEKRNQEFADGDVQHVLELLSHLIVSDVIDFSSQHGSLSQPSNVDSIAVVFTGLFTILPSISEELLLIPSICEAFFGVVGHLCSDYSDRFTTLSPQLIASLTQSIDFGIKHDAANIARESLRGVEGLVGSGVVSSDTASKWVTDIFQIVIFQDAVWDRMDGFADALLGLCCSSLIHLESLVNLIISSQPTEEYQQRLTHAFHNLFSLNGLQMQLDRANRLIFRKNLKHFVSEARAFMRSK